MLWGLIALASQSGSGAQIGRGSESEDYNSERGAQMRSAGSLLEDEARRDAQNGNWEDAERKRQEADTLGRTSF